ncbi:uncharacterized protein EI90DRAFT_3131717 [Cantharellus anzutake]|uniref:uncharacterized protein n=1 Tax=Cantharellus anzutake TaxID=1750568 RepID=UPI0019060DD7|nr:uncharacterized protein EI90DRAFT_3131717 [Cantharellus anzutake]KAF8321070.1 hypothetical protein EI90DRAFT_3131717 [Cantharellus anzutake]
MRLFNLIPWEARDPDFKFTQPYAHDIHLAKRVPVQRSRSGSFSPNLQCPDVRPRRKFLIGNRPPMRSYLILLGFNLSGFRSSDDETLGGRITYEKATIELPYITKGRGTTVMSPSDATVTAFH